MPEVQNAMCVAAEKSRTVYDVSLVLYQRIKQYPIFGGIVFQVSILDDNINTRRFLNPPPEGSTFTHVLWLQHYLDLWVVSL